MLPTFVIGLREGLEAALIVGIIAAFLRKQGRRDLLRWVLGGVGLAIALCLAAGLALHAFAQDLPQRQQEGMETVIGVLAVGMVTYMVVWMRRHSRDLKGQLEGLAADAMGGGGNAARALVAMAFLAVIREGLETVVFAIAIFDASTASTASSASGLILGLLLAAGLGYAIYRGGVRLNLSKFFRFTGVVLVLVAAGLVVNAFHTAHEAGWVDFGQGRTVNLSWLVEPGSVRSSLLTGMLGLQPQPVTVEVIGWLAYLIPVGLYVGWPPGRPVPLRATAIWSGALGAAAAVAAVLCAALAPSVPSGLDRLTASSSAGTVSIAVTERTADHAVASVSAVDPGAGRVGAPASYRLSSQGAQPHGGRTSLGYATTLPGAPVTGRPARLSVAQIATLNGGRLPYGITGAAGSVAASYAERTTVELWVDERTGTVLDARWSSSVTATLNTGTVLAQLDRPVATAQVSLTAAVTSRQAGRAAAAADDLSRRSDLHTAAGWTGGLAVVALVTAAGAALLGRRRPQREARPSGDRPLATAKV